MNIQCPECTKGEWFTKVYCWKMEPIPNIQPNIYERVFFKCEICGKKYTHKEMKIIVEAKRLLAKPY